jgi:hypothetical protein
MFTTHNCPRFCRRPSYRGFHRAKYRLQIRIHCHERVVWLGSFDLHPILAGDLCSRHSLKIDKHVLNPREGGPDTYTQEPIHLAYPVAQSQPPCDFAFPQFHLLHLEPVPRHVSIQRLLSGDVGDIDCL